MLLSQIRNQIRHGIGPDSACYWPGSGLVLDQIWPTFGPNHHKGIRIWPRAGPVLVQMRKNGSMPVVPKDAGPSPLHESGPELPMGLGQMIFA
ncbi:hypothetical protein M9458_051445, partial [Cirrhinus mrigala]